MEYISNSPDVESLSDAQLEVLEVIHLNFMMRIKSEAYVFETIHGHVVEFSFCEDCFLKSEAGKPGRFDHLMAALFTDPGIRWVEFGTDKIKVAV